MSNFTNNCFGCSCWEFAQRSTDSDGDHEIINDPDDSDDSDDPLLWSYDLGPHSAGEFSHAVVQANARIEDHSLVEVADGAIFVGVYDGHGGDAASIFVRDELFSRFNRIAKESHTINENVLKEAFAETESEFLNLVRRERDVNSSIKSVGSCCLAGVIWGGSLYVANAGDSRVVIGRKCQSGGVVWAEQLTEDDNCRRASVRRELKAANPYDQSIVYFSHGSWRVRGITEVSRSIGDAYLKDQEFAFPIGHGYFFSRHLTRPVLSPIPNVHVRKLHRNDRFLIFASDGLWDAMSNRRAVKIVRNNPRNGIAKRLIQEAMRVSARKAKLTDHELRHAVAGNRRYIHDDMSVVVVYIDPQEPGQESLLVPDLVRIGGFANGPEPGRFDLEGIHLNQ